MKTWLIYYVMTLQKDAGMLDNSKYESEEGRL